jgi:hypothetical protein
MIYARVVSPKALYGLEWMNAELLLFILENKLVSSWSSWK